MNNSAQINDANSFSLAQIVPHCPVMLVLDTSHSMWGKGLSDMTRSLKAFHKTIQDREYVSSQIDIASVSMGDNLGMIEEFTPFNASRLCEIAIRPKGATPIGAALSLAVGRITERLQSYRSLGYSYITPQLVLLSDGKESADDFTQIADVIRRMCAKGELFCHAIAMGEKPNCATLMRIAGNNIVRPQYGDLRNAFVTVGMQISDTYECEAAGHMGAALSTEETHIASDGEMQQASAADKCQGIDVVPDTARCTSDWEAEHAPEALREYGSTQATGTPHDGGVVAENAPVSDIGDASSSVAGEEAATEIEEVSWQVASACGGVVCDGDGLTSPCIQEAGRVGKVQGASNEDAGPETETPPCSSSINGVRASATQSMAGEKAQNASIEYILDGSNILYWDKFRGGISLKYVLAITNKLDNLGKKYQVYFDASARHILKSKNTQESILLESLFKERGETFFQTPPREEADTYLLFLASQNPGSKVISNDLFRDHAAEYPWVNNQGRLLQGMVLGNRIFIPGDKLVIPVEEPENHLE